VIDNWDMENVKITSKDNAQIKKLKKLQMKKYRDEFGEFCVENFKIICDAAEAGVRFEEIYVTDAFVEKNKVAFDKLARAVADKCFLIDEAINKHFSELETPSGVCAVYVKEERPLDFGKPAIYLNGINDPGNLGTILRSALAFDFENVVIDETCVDLYNAKVINAAKDSIFKLNFAFDKSGKILREFKSKKYLLAGTGVKGKSGELSDLKKGTKVCFLFGSEAHGLAEELVDCADSFVNIKTSGKIESLNVGSAAAIIMHAYFSRS